MKHYTCILAMLLFGLLSACCDGGNSEEHSHDTDAVEHHDHDHDAEGHDHHGDDAEGELEAHVCTDKCSAGTHKCGTHCGCGEGCQCTAENTCSSACKIKS